MTDTNKQTVTGSRNAVRVPLSKMTAAQWQAEKDAFDGVTASGDAPRETCNICCRALSDPYRQYDERGKVTEGCVDACHTHHLVVPSESAWWHDRPEARKIRKALAFGRKI